MPDVLRFVHISDTHITPDTDYIKSYAPYTPILGAKALVQAVRDLPFQPDFILHTGDVAFDPHPDVYPTIAGLMAEFDAPVHCIAGNHDDSEALQTLLMGRNKTDVQDYLHYEFEAKGVQVVCVDSNAPHHHEDAGAPAGRVPDEQLTWLDDLCTADDDRPLIIAIHHNVLPVGVPWLDDWMRTENGEDFHQVVRQARDRLQGVFHGHIHQNITTFKDGVLYSAAASSWCQFMSYPIAENKRVSADSVTPPGFSVVTVDNGRTFIRRHTFEVNE
jgi:Icc protein